VRSPVVTALACIAATGIAGCGAPRAEPAPRPQPPVVPLLVDPVSQRPDVLQSRPVGHGGAGAAS